MFRDILRLVFGQKAAPVVQETPAVKRPAPARPESPIKKAVVIGSGPIGSGYAAQMANAGVQVTMLDLKKSPDPNALAKASIARMLGATPDKDPLNAGFMSRENAKLITPGNMEDDIGALADADLVIEAVPEVPAIKRSVWDVIEKNRKPGCVVASVTSTIRLHILTEGRSEEFRKHAMILHPSNPVRFMRSIEYVAGETAPETVAEIVEFGAVHLGKVMIEAKDTPAFIFNRIGIPFIQNVIGQTIDRGLKIEDVDAIFGRPLGMPKSGVFGMLDMVGLGLIPMVTKSLKGSLPPEDFFHVTNRDVPVIDKMIEEGRTGRHSGKGGFFRLLRNEDGSKRPMDVIDLTTGDYRPAEESDWKSVKAGRAGLRAVFETDDAMGRLARDVMIDTFAYAAGRVPEISDRVDTVDLAMRVGFNWKRGPFEMIDQLGNDQETGADYVIRQLQERGKDVPPLLRMATGKTFYKDDTVLTPDFTAGTARYEPVESKPGILSLASIKKSQEPVASNSDAGLWDMGDGALCMEMHGMKNSVGPGTMDMLNEACDLIESSNGKYKGLLIYNDSEHFSVGANLGLASIIMNLGDQDQLDDVIWTGQSTLERLKYAPFPVVAAVGGYAFGGGCEIALHSDAIQAHAETYMGLVEVGVGLIPAWGGCKEYLQRCIIAAEKSPLLDPPELRAFETIGTAKVSTSAQEARNLLFLRDTDGITMNRDRLLGDAKAKMLKLVNGYKPPEPFTYRLMGEGGKALMQMAVNDFYRQGLANWQDVRVMEVLSDVLSGGDTNPSRITTERGLMALEREGFMRMTMDSADIDSPVTGATRRRVRHTVNTGKPLREEPLVHEMSPAELRATIPDVIIKDRSTVPRPLDRTMKSAPAAERPAANIKSMSAPELMGFMAQTLGNDNSKIPVPAGALAEPFNKAVADTRAFWVNKINGMKSYTRGMGSERVLNQADSWLAKSIGGTNEKLAAAATEEERSALLGRRQADERIRQNIAALRAQL